jgi:hypothetical protein
MTPPMTESMKVVLRNTLFEIRFRLNSTIPLAAGKGTFGFSSILQLRFRLFKKLIRLNCKQSFFHYRDFAFLETQMEMEF